MHLHAGGVGMSTSRTKLGIGNTSICPSALAPMQDVTGLPFMSLVADRGPARLVFSRNSLEFTQIQGLVPQSSPP
jgi:hypothetical protein